MAIADISRTKTRENMKKSGKKGEKNDKKILLVAQELKLARVLAGNNKPARDKALKNLKKWFQHRSETMPFTEDDLQRIWKGLFYSMWMSDKPLIQEECAETISNLVHFPTIEASLMFFKCGLTILINEWFGIDQLRLDKFLMLVRRLLRQMFVELKNNHFNKKYVDIFSDVLSETILNAEKNVPLGLFMHFTEIYLEELAKVTNGKINSERMTDILRPFIKKLSFTRDGRQISQIRKFIFIYLMRQSDLGLEYEAKYDAWKREGFPGNINSMQKVPLEEDEVMSSDDEAANLEEKDKPMDPRAGRVDVELPQIKFSSKLISKALLEFKFDKKTNSKSRQMLSTISDEFKKMSRGVYPLGITQVIKNEKDTYDSSMKKAVSRLAKFDKKVMGKGKDDKKKRKREKSAENVTKRVKLDEEETGDNFEEKEDSEEEETTNLDDFIKKSEGFLSKKHKKVQNGDNKQKKVQHGDVKQKKIQNGDIKQMKIQNGSENSLKLSKKDKKINTNYDLVASSKKLSKKAKNKTKKMKYRELMSKIDYIFERNSGTWLVFKENEKRSPDLNLSSSDLEQVSEIRNPDSDLSSDLGNFFENSYSGDSPSAKKIKSPEKKKKSLEKAHKSPELSQKSPETFKVSSENVELTPNQSPKDKDQKKSPKQSTPIGGIEPVNLFSASDKQELFPKSEWDEPLKEGEYEICIPSKKHVEKLKNVAKNSNQNVQELINKTLTSIKGKSRMSLPMAKNKIAFSTPTTNSCKKVKINTKLNKSQEFYEHHAQIMSSPAIPYDANKKPSKPLLKVAVNTTPLNPFYKRRSIW